MTGPPAAGGWLPPTTWTPTGRPVPSGRPGFDEAAPARAQRRAGRAGRPGVRLVAVSLALAALALVAGGLRLVVTSRNVVGPPPAPLPERAFALASATTSARPGPPAAGPGPRLAVDHVYVPSLGVAAQFVPEPLVDGSLRIPDDIATVALAADGGELRGSGGSVVLAGHVNWAGIGPGAFAPLYRVQPGAAVWLVDGRRHVSTWAVTSLADPVKTEVGPDLVTRTGARRLVLITCGGAVHDGSYDRNVVVTAIPLR